jgi:hypothetical protein
MQKIIKQIGPKFCQEEDVMGVQSFQINVPQAMLDDLQARLARTRWPGESRASDGTMALTWAT